MNKISESKVFILLEKTFYLPLVLLVIAGFLSKAPYAESFWVDETLSWWITSNNLVECIWRALDLQGQSPFYYVVLLYWGKLFGTTEIALRSFSLLCAIICSGIFFLLLRRFSLSIVASIAGTIFLFSHDTLVPLWVSARPYAFALVWVLLSTLLFDRWLKEKKGGFLYIFTASAAFYAHYLVSPIILVHFIWGLISKSRTVSNLISFFLWVALLCSFGGPQISALLERKKELSFQGLTIGDGFIQVFSPIPLLIVSAVGFSFLLLGGKIQKPKIQNEIMVWLAAGVIGFTLAALLVLFPIVPRYFIWVIPATPFLFASLFSVSSQKQFQVLALIVISVLFSMFHSERKWMIEDFKGGASFLEAERAGDENIPVFLFSGLVEHQTKESKDPELLNAYLSAPLSYYGINGVIPIVIPSVREMAEKAKEQHTKILLMLRVGEYFGIESPDSLISTFREAGFEIKREQRFSGLKGYLLVNKESSKELLP